MKSVAKKDRKQVSGSQASGVGKQTPNPEPRTLAEAEPDVKLSAKQRVFCDTLDKQKRPDVARAVMKAKYKVKNKATAKEYGKRLMKNKHVQKYLAYLRRNKKQSGNVVSDINRIMRSAEENGNYEAALEAAKFKAKLLGSMVE